MPIAPITGKLRKRFWLDFSVALGMGVSAGYAFWSVSLVFRYTILPNSFLIKVWRSLEAR